MNISHICWVEINFFSSEKDLEMCITGTPNALMVTEGAGGKWYNNSVSECDRA